MLIPLLQEWNDSMPQLSLGLSFSLMGFPTILMWSTGNDVSGPLFWHERSALQSVAVRWSIGNDISGYFICRYFAKLSLAPAYLD